MADDKTPSADPGGETEVARSLLSIQQIVAEMTEGKSLGGHPIQLTPFSGDPTPGDIPPATPTSQAPSDPAPASPESPPPPSNTPDTPAE